MAASIFKKLVGFAKGFQVKTTAGNVHDTAPTIAQLTTEFASTTQATMAEVQIVNDAAGGVNVYIAAKVGSDFFFTKMTKAA
jgi:uncharacterized metal-binding protein